MFVGLGTHGRNAAARQFTLSYTLPKKWDRESTKFWCNWQSAGYCWYLCGTFMNFRNVRQHEALGNRGLDLINRFATYANSTSRDISLLECLYPITLIRDLRHKMHYSTYSYSAQTGTCIRRRRTNSVKQHCRAGCTTMYAP